jgi:hypothetical protein
MLIEQRLKKDWYQKRITQNKNIKNHLIDVILENQSSDFFWSNLDLQYLNYEDLFEVAVASANKQVSITLGEGSDLSNNVDCKFSIVRSNSYGKNYSALISGCENKDHIYACVYEGMNEKFYYFSFPASIKQHTIPFDQTGKPNRSNYMWRYEKSNLVEMALDK